MPLLRAHFILLALFWLGMPPATAADDDTLSDTKPFQVNSDYSIVSPTDAIEHLPEQLPPLLLVGWYGSESCYQVFGALKTHLKSYSLTFWPAILRESWRPAAKLSILANKLALTDEEHLALFKKIQLQSIHWHQSGILAELLKSIVTDPQKIPQPINQSELAQTLKKQQKLLLHYNISTVPTIIFKGKYVITAQQAKTSRRLIQLLHYLDGLNVIETPTKGENLDQQGS